MSWTARPMALVFLTIAVPATVAGRADAGMIVYTETVHANGSLGNVPFLNTLATFTFVGDTANVTSPSAGIFRNAIGTATVKINGLTGTFTGAVDVFVNQTNSTAGIETYDTILTVMSGGLNGYDLAGATGPLTGNPGGGGTGITFATTGGDLELDGLTSAATFLATVPATVPEPCSLALCGVAGAIVGVAALGRRKRVA